MSQQNDLETDEEMDKEEQEFLSQLGRDEEEQENDLQLAADKGALDEPN